MYMDIYAKVKAYLCCLDLRKRWFASGHCKTLGTVLGEHIDTVLSAVMVVHYERKT